MKTLTCSGITALLLFVVAGCGGQEDAQDMQAADGMSVDTTEELGAPSEELTFRAALSGDAEVPGPGDPDGSGSAEVDFTPAEGTVCFEITVESIAEAQAAHIHSGAAGESGPPVVNFDVANNGLSGCVEAEEDVIQSIVEAPSNYYVNVHNEEYGAGAVRGQLATTM
jgi:hypothetical protein